MENETLVYVIADLRDRAEVGVKKYGHYLDQSPDNMLQHAYEEALDLCMYLKAEINKKKSKKSTTVVFTRDDFNRSDNFAVTYPDGKEEFFSIRDSFKKVEGFGSILALRFEEMLRQQREREVNEHLPLSMGDYL